MKYTILVQVEDSVHDALLELQLSETKKAKRKISISKLVGNILEKEFRVIPKSEIVLEEKGIEE